MKKLFAPILIIVLFLSSCSMGDFCKISDVKLRIFNKVTDVTVDEGNDAFFYASKKLTDVCVYKMEWDYDSERYIEKEKLANGITLQKNDALRIIFDNKSELPYVRITFTNSDGKTEERYIFEDKNGRQWVLNLENSD